MLSKAGLGEGAKRPSRLRHLRGRYAVYPNYFSIYVNLIKNESKNLNNNIEYLNHFYLRPS
ncbi:unnamed protein product [marine sediment metagenome]|uniref:Uncharacterized protein n=1 Tax=marine sediment metagenome TaxID=412755 RepID=X1VUB7_9ZZZZ